MISLFILLTGVVLAKAEEVERFRAAATQLLRAETKNAGVLDNTKAEIATNALAYQLSSLYAFAAEHQGLGSDERHIYKVASAAIIWLKEISFHQGFIGNEMTARRLAVALGTLLRNAIEGGGSFESTADTKAHAQHVFRRGSTVVSMISQLDPTFKDLADLENSGQINTVFDRVADLLDRGCEFEATTRPSENGPT